MAQLGSAIRKEPAADAVEVPAAAADAIAPVVVVHKPIRPARVAKLPRLTICGVQDIEHHRNRKITQIISIWDAAAKPKEEEILSRLHKNFPSASVHLTFFDDVEHETEGCVPPDREHLEPILDFAREHQGDPSVLVHCFAGVSRSPAIGYALACQTVGKSHEHAVFEYMLRLRPQMVPNRRVVRLADDLLERNGAMYRIVDHHWKKIAPAYLREHAALAAEKAQ